MAQNSHKLNSKQLQLEKKIDNAAAGISSLVSKLAAAEEGDSETTSAVHKLISTVSPDVNVPTSSSQPKKIKYNLSNEEMQLICQQVNELFNDLSSFRSELSSMSDDILQIKEQHDKDIKEMKKKLDDEVKSLKQSHTAEINSLKEKVNANDQYLRSNNLLLTFKNQNLYIPNAENMNGAEFAQNVAWLLNNYLPMLHTPINMYNINIAHPLRLNAKGQPIIIVRFVNRHIHHNVYENREFLSRYGILVTEHLTVENVRLLNQAKSIVGQENAWSFNGKLFAISNNKRVIIKRDSDLSSLTKPDERLVPRKSNSYDRYSRPNRGHYHRPIYRGRDDYRYNNR